MPFPNGFIRQTLNFTLPGGEVASITFGWDSGGLIGLSEAAADDFATAAGGLWGNIRDRYSATVLYTGSRIAKYGSDGLLQVAYERAVVPVGGSSAAENLPTEVAVCASLKTALSSRRTRGRVFLPNPTVTCVTAAGRLTTVAQTDFVDALAAYLTTFNADGDPMRSCVVSETGQLLTPVTSVNVGDVFDVQRRRRDALLEVRADAPVA